AKRELVDSRTSLLGEAGLEAGIIDVDAFAIHNAFELNHPDAMQGVVGLVNIGHEVTNVNILEDGVPVLTRDLSVGTRRFREDLQREKGLSAEDSERVIQGQAQSGDLAQYVDARREERRRPLHPHRDLLATASRSAGGLGRGGAGAVRGGGRGGGRGGRRGGGRRAGAPGRRRAGGGGAGGGGRGARGRRRRGGGGRAPAGGVQPRHARPAADGVHAPQA